MPDMENRPDSPLQRLIDEAEIRDVLACYCRGVDRGDAGLIAGAYWEDAADHHGSFDGNAHEFAQWNVANQATRFSFAHHMLGQSLIRFAGDVAGVETYFTYISTTRGNENGGGASVLRALGRYADRFERRQGQWKIAERWVVYDLVDSAPCHAVEGFDTTGFHHGCRGPGDPSCLVAPLAAAGSQPA